MGDTYREKFVALDQEKNRIQAHLTQKEEQLLEEHNKRETEMRNEWNLKKLEFTKQYDDKLHKLQEERAALQRDYEQKLRELELRERKDRPRSSDA